MDNKPIYKKDNIFSPNKAYAVIGYVLMLFVLSSFLIYGISYIYANINNLSYSELIDSITKLDNEYSYEIIKGNSIVQGWSNFIVYALAAFIVIFYLRDEIVTDFFDLRKRRRFHFWYIPVTTISFVVIAYLIDVFMANFVRDSANQETIVSILQNDGAIPMILASVLLAPLLEELIFRKCIFYYFKKYGIWLSYLISILLFTLPHMLSTTNDIATWLLQCIPYSLCGFMLAFIYHKSNCNIYATIMAHMANNILAVIMVYSNI